MQGEEEPLGVFLESELEYKENVPGTVICAGICL